MPVDDQAADWLESLCTTRMRILPCESLLIVVLRVAASVAAKLEGIDGRERDF